MTPLLVGVIWLALVIGLLLRMVRQFRIHEAETLVTPNPHFVANSVRVIVPARDEIANIEACLRSLAAQTQTAAGFAVLVVDDGSQDGTAGVVRHFAAADPRVALLEAGGLPPGWMGKPHARWRGALASGENWLCFVDADARAEPALIAAAMQAAETQGIDMLCLLPRHELGSFWERLVIPTGLLMVACSRTLRLPSGKDSADIAVNGQFILIRREAYFAVGGHASIRAELCEDKALACRVRAAGFRDAALAADPLLRARLYSGLRSLWQGFARSAVEIMGDGRRTLAVALAAVAVGWAVPLLPVGAAIAARSHPGVAAWFGLALTLAGSGIVLGVLLGATRHFGVSRWFALLFPLGATLAAAIACHSAMPGPRRRIRWKGRPCAAASSARTGLR